MSNKIRYTKTVIFQRLNISFVIVMMHQSSCHLPELCFVFFYLITILKFMMYILKVNQLIEVKDKLDIFVLSLSKGQ